MRAVGLIALFVLVPVFAVAAQEAEPLSEEEIRRRAQEALEAYAAEVQREEQALEPELLARFESLEQDLEVAQAHALIGQGREAGAVFLRLRKALPDLEEALAGRSTRRFAKLERGVLDLARELLDQRDLAPGKEREKATAEEAEPGGTDDSQDETEPAVEQPAEAGTDGEAQVPAETEDPNPPL